MEVTMDAYPHAGEANLHGNFPPESHHHLGLIRYSRHELLNLQSSVDDFPHSSIQILPLIQPFFDELCTLTSDHLTICPPRRRNVDRRQRNACKSHHPAGEFELFPENVELPLTAAVDSHEFVTEEEDIFEDSDDDRSLQPLAFFVEGEPNFEAGPPEDGYEYLRRVMWESAQCPKVVTAKIDREKIASKQTVYMPVIPPVPECSIELLPSKDWIKAFQADFSNLRAELSNHMPPLEDISQDLLPLPPIRNKAIWKTFCFCRTNYSDLHDNLIDKEEGDVASVDLHEENCTSSTDEDAIGNENVCEVAAHLPLLKILLRLDEVSRATLFRYHVSWLQEQQNLSYERALWLFALAAVVDAPLDDQTSASFRDLLRKCAELRMHKKYVDEELHMLNILITIAGVYFGQAEDSGM